MEHQSMKLLRHAQMLEYSVLPGAAAECIEKFMSGGIPTPAGVTLLGRWHNVSGGTGYTLYETDQPAQIYRSILGWADLVEFEVNVVLEDAEIGKVMMEVFKK
jgi:hypothetical protein